MIRLNDILEKVSAYHGDADLDLVKKAYVYSAKVHQGQIRKSGEPYLVHSLEVAGLLADLKLDEASILAWLLHDTIDDTLAKPELEDLAFKYLKPGEYADVETQLAQSQKDRQKFIADVVDLLQTKLKEAGLEAEVHGRPKHVYSIWKKMRKNGLSSVTQLHDVV